MHLDNIANSLLTVTPFQLSTNQTNNAEDSCQGFRNRPYHNTTQALNKEIVLVLPNPGMCCSALHTIYIHYFSF